MSTLQTLGPIPTTEEPTLSETRGQAQLWMSHGVRAHYMGCVQDLLWHPVSYMVSTHSLTIKKARENWGGVGLLWG